jgi:hypothetical protein
MGPSALGTKLASSLVTPLVRELVDRAAHETREAPLGTAELEAVTDALEVTLHALGDLDLDDVQASGRPSWPAPSSPRADDWTS